MAERRQRAAVVLGGGERVLGRWEATTLPATKLILAINMAVFVLQLAAVAQTNSSLGAIFFPPQDLTYRTISFQYGAMLPEMVWGGHETFRLLSACFVLPLEDSRGMNTKARRFLGDPIVPTEVVAFAMGHRTGRFDAPRDAEGAPKWPESIVNQLGGEPLSRFPDSRDDGAAERAIDALAALVAATLTHMAGILVGLPVDVPATQFANVGDNGCYLDGGGVRSFEERAKLNGFREQFCPQNDLYLRQILPRYP